jgi:hypothetical protein
MNNRMVITLARWMAKKAVKAEWKAKGHKEKIGEIGRATKLYFTEHEKELIKQAWEHPVANEQRPKGQMIVEFRNGRWVKSIDVGKLFEDYLKEYPEDRAVKTKVCYDE